ncbi:MAG: TetR/AcrR family transcriptional regulator [Bacillota bacterium]
MPKSDAGPLRDRKKEACRAEIYQSAIRLFMKKGYDQTTVEEIAEAANVSKATFFNYFPRKEEIVNFYRKEMVKGVLAGWRKLMKKRGLTPLQRLKTMTLVIGEQFENRREAARLLVWRQLGMYAGADALFDTYQDYISLISQVIVEGQKEGEIKDYISPALVVESLLGITFFQVFKWISDKDSDPLKERLEIAFDMFADGIKA